MQRLAIMFLEACGSLKVLGMRRGGGRRLLTSNRGLSPVFPFSGFLGFSFFSFLFFSGGALSAETGFGAILTTQGHVVPRCRMVKHKETATGIERWFRIQDVVGDDDVGSVILAAFLANREVNIWFEPGVTTGCGSEPQITYVSIK